MSIFKDFLAISDGGVPPVITSTLKYKSYLDSGIVTPTNVSAFEANILSNTFDDTTKIGTITFDRVITKIGNDAFKNTNLKSIFIPAHVHNIGDNAFDGCTYLMTVELENKPTVGVNSFGETNFQSNNLWGNDFCRINCSYDTKQSIEQDANWSSIINCFVPKPTLDEDKYYFSVSASKKVIFSYGNLRYRASINKFTFSPHQEVAIGNTVGNTTSPNQRQYDTNCIDLFSWACSGGDFGGYHYHYKPYDCIYYNNSSYAYYYGIVMGSSSYAYSITGTGGDWGIANSFENHPIPTGWRTLTNTEWNYLYNNRTNASSKRAWARINGMCGMILLPDNWELPSGVTIKTNTSGYTTNTYTVEEWTLLENNGAVFLPASGYRKALTGNKNITTADDYTGTGTISVGDFNSVGSYWSTVYYNASAYRFYFQNASAAPNNSNGTRYYGYSVRVVRDVTI